MTNLPFFKFDSGAWLTGKVQLLSALEKGVFIDLIARIWHNGGSIPNDEILHRLLRVEKGTLSEALKAFCEIGIMTEENGILRVKFIDEQIFEVDDYRKQQAEFGARGGRPKKGTKANRERRNKREEKDNITPLPPHGGERATSENILEDEIFQRLNPCFLNSSSPQDALPAVRDALEESGVTLEYLIDRCETYGRYIRLWPQEERRFSYSLTSFLRAGHFREDETIWQREPSQRPKNNSPTGASGHEISEEDMKVYEQYTGLHR